MDWTAVALQCLSKEAQSRRFVSFLGDIAFEDLALMIDGAPQIVRLAVDLYEDLIEVPAPVSEAAHSADALSFNVSCEQWTEAVPPKPHRFMANVDTSFSK